MSVIEIISNLTGQLGATRGAYETLFIDNQTGEWSYQLNNQKCKLADSQIYIENFEIIVRDNEVVSVQKGSKSK